MPSQIKELPIGEVINHPKFGPVQLIKDLGYQIKSSQPRRIVTVKFLNSGYEYDIRYSQFINGQLEDEWYGMEFGKLYPTNSYGMAKLLRYVGKSSEGRAQVEIEFVNSNCKTVVDFRQLQKGSVGDPQYGISFDRLYPTNNSGPIQVLKLFSPDQRHPRALVRFIMTGAIKDVSIDALRIGRIKDDTNPNIIPIDKSLIVDWDAWVIDRLKRVWRGMMNRCYDPTSNAYHSYGAIGVRVAEDWHNVNQFLIDARSLFQFSKYYQRFDEYELDKDYLQLAIPKAQRVYSKATCVFLYYLDNLNLRYIDQDVTLLSSQYFGVRKSTEGTFIASIKLNGYNKYIGTFNNEIAAAAAYNYYVTKYHPYDIIPLFNSVPSMSPEEFIHYNTAPKQLYRIIKSDQ